MMLNVKSEFLRFLLCVLFFQSCTFLHITKTGNQYSKLKGGKIVFSSSFINSDSMFVYDTLSHVNMMPNQGIILRLDEKLKSNKLYSPAAINGSIDSLINIEFLSNSKESKEFANFSNILLNQAESVRKIHFYDFSNQAIINRVGSSKWDNIQADKSSLDVMFVSRASFIAFFNNFEESGKPLGNFIFYFDIDSNELTTIIQNSTRIKIKFTLVNKLTKFKRYVYITKVLDKPSIEYYNLERKNGIEYYNLR